MNESSMRRALAVGLAATLVSAPMPALADGEGGTGDKGTDMVLDLVVLRPMGLLATGIGSLVFVVSLPFTLTSGNVGQAACELVREPAAYTFTRPLGDIDGSGAGCAGR